MSLTKSAATRLSLLAGSSLVAALSAGCLLIAPTTAAAATNPCGEDPAADGATADIIVCPAGDYPTGIQHTSSGDLDVTVQVLSTFGTGGVVSSAGASSSNTDDIVLRLGGTVSVPFTDYSTAFPILLDAQSQQGDILVDFAFSRAGDPTGSALLSVSNAVTTHIVKAISNAGGDVVVLRSAGIGSISATGAGNIAAVEARSIGGGNVTVGGGQRSLSVSGGQYGILAAVDGAGDLTVLNASGNAVGSTGIAGIHATSTGSGDISITSSGSAQGQLYGLFAQTTGSGTVTVASNGSADATAGIAGIYAKANAGLLTVTGTGTGGSGTGVLLDAGGNVVFTGGGSGGQYGVDVTNVAAGTTTTLNLGQTTGSIAAVRARGAGALVVNVSGTTSIHYDFSGMADPVAVNFNTGAVWRVPTGASNGPTGDVTVNFPAGAAIISESQKGAVAPAIVTFTDPGVVIDNKGVVIIGPAGNGEKDFTANPGELRLAGLGEFRHSGKVLLGGKNRFIPDEPAIEGIRTDTTDGWRDDIFSLPGAHWVGEDGQVVFDVDFGRGQASCTRDPTTGDLPAADCLMLVGGATEGVTYVVVNPILPGDRLRPAEEGILLVDVAGGTSAQGDFVIDPGTANYTPMFGGSIDNGVYHSVIAYDEATQQHRLVGTMSAGSYQFAQFSSAAQELWRVSTGTWLERQADMRGDLEDGIGGGIWLRASGQVADRDVVNPFVLAGQDFAFDNTYEQTSYAVTGGLDLVSGGGADSAWVLGVMTGYAHADVEYEASATAGSFDGFTAGGYASYLAGGLYIDAAVNANRLILKDDNPTLNIFPAGAIVDTILVSVGGQVEAGWRLPITETVFVEPLASVSYVRSKYDDLYIVSSDPARPGIDVEFDDPTSLRASVGGRAGVEQDFGFVRTQFSVLGRVWNEFEGENVVLIRNRGASDAVSDDFSGRFNELALGAAVHSPSGVVSGFLNLGGKFGDDYEARTGSIGVRVSW